MDIWIISLRLLRLLEHLQGEQTWHLVLELLQLSISMPRLFSKPLKLPRKSSDLLFSKTLRRIGVVLEIELCTEKVADIGNWKIQKNVP